MSKSEVIEINAGIRELADRIKPELKVGDNGIVPVAKDFYAKFLPENVTPKMVNDVASARSTFMAAQALAVGEVANDHFKTNKTDEAVSILCQFGDGRATDRIEQEVLRVKTTTNAFKGGAQETNYNVLSKNKFIASGTKNSSGHMKTIVAHLRSLGAEANG
jgi:hypothetical protein